MITPKKILFLGPAYPFRGGIADSSERLASELQLQGHEVFMFTYTTQYPRWIFPGESQFAQKAEPKDLKIERLYSSINPFSWISARRKIRALKPDLIVSRFWLPYIGFSAAYILKGFKDDQIKTVSIVDNLIPHQKMPGDDWLIKYYMKSHNDFIAMSSSVCEEIKERFSGKRLLHIPHPIYDIYGSSLPKIDACQALALDPNKKYLLFFGFIKDYKGLDLLLNALDIQYMHDHNIVLIIAGEVYGSADKYFEIIKNRNLGDYIIFHKKFIPDADVKHYFSAADLVVQTYLTATQSGISQMALQFEKPVLVTDVGGLSEMVLHRKTGYVVPKDPLRIFEAIMDFFDQKRMEEFLPHIIQLKQKNGWDTFAQNMMHFSFPE